MKVHLTTIDEEFQKGQVKEHYKTVKGKTVFVQAYNTSKTKKNEPGKKAGYMGNCQNSFDKDTGEDLIGLFDDVNHFARLEEGFDEAVKSGKRDYMSKEEFESHVDLPDFLKQKKLMFYNYGDPNIFVAYDDKKDVHHFFKG